MINQLYHNRYPEKKIISGFRDTGNMVDQQPLSPDDPFHVHPENFRALVKRPVQGVSGRLMPDKFLYCCPVHMTLSGMKDKPGTVHEAFVTVGRNIEFRRLTGDHVRQRLARGRAHGQTV